MKNILVINGSPKKEKSSTMVVTRAFVEGIKKAGEFESEIVDVAALNIKSCRDCLSCWGRSAGECVIKDDDVPSVKQKILSADIIVLSFPLFFFGMPGQLKMLLDRLLSMLNAYSGQEVPENGSFHGFRYDMSGKKFIIISGCAWNDQRVFDPLIKQFDCIVGHDRYETLFCPQVKAVVDQGMKPRLVRYLKNYEEAGEEFGRNGCFSPETRELLKKTPFSRPVYKQILEKFWEKEIGNEA